jgi:hypothetical protein
VDLLENVIKGVDGQPAHFDEFHNDLFRHFKDKFFFLLHDISPEKPPLSGRRQFLVCTAGVSGLRRTLKSPPWLLTLAE